MKKTSNKIIVAIIVLLIILSIIVVIALIQLNKEKKSITTDDFANSMKEKGYEVTDASNKYSNYDKVLKSYVASDSNNNFKIEFYELSDKEYAQTFYNNYISIYGAPSNSISEEKNTSRSNYSKYVLSSNEEYIVISKIDNTIMYARVGSNYKDTIKTVFESMGY